MIRRLTTTWCLVQVNGGREGLFPASLLSLKVASSKDNAENDSSRELESGTIYRAFADYSSGGRCLVIKACELFTLIKRMSKDWLMMRATDGQVGLVPANHVRLAGSVAPAHLMRSIADYTDGGQGQVILNFVS